MASTSRFAGWTVLGAALWLVVGGSSGASVSPSQGGHGPAAIAPPSGNGLGVTGSGAVSLGSGRVGDLALTGGSYRPAGKNIVCQFTITNGGATADRLTGAS